jgi:hypothetical protein
MRDSHKLSIPEDAMAAKVARRDASVLFEKFGEVGKVGETGSHGNFFDSRLAIQQPFTDPA